ncbi:MAG: hypothetical protein JST92_27810 [Deltaproteobacteria bacterium]|nr:hypothetical protein [Deltaproteobacteria bacterium]
MARTPLLPTEAEVDALVALDRNLGLAEARLGGGLSVAVRARGQAVVMAGADGRPLTELESEALVEADRAVRLAIGKSVDIEVTAGSPEARKAVAALRADWFAHGVPALERAQADSLAELLTQTREAQEQQQTLVIQGKELASLQREARAFAEQALALEQNGAVTVDVEELTRMKSLYRADLEPSLSSAFAKLGRGWEGHVDGLLSNAEAKRKVVGDSVGEMKRALDLADYRAAEFGKAASAAFERASQLSAPFGSGGVAAESAANAAMLSSLLQEETATASALQIQEESASQATAQAQRELEVATVASAAAARDANVARNTLDDARAEYHKHQGELTQAREQLKKANRPAIAAMLIHRKDELASLPLVPPTTSQDLVVAEDSVASAERAASTILQELHTSEGALAHVGGAALADQAERLREALDAARVREREL